MQNIVLQMMDFQHFNKIKGARNTNAKCMHDILKKMSPTEKIEVYPAIVTSYNKESESGVVVHLIVLAVEGPESSQVMLDPSYDVFSLENKRYYLNIKEFVDAIENPEKKQNELKSLARDFLLLAEIAKQINEGTFDMFNRELYEKQTEYVKIKCALCDSGFI